MNQKSKVSSGPIDGLLTGVVMTAWFVRGLVFVGMLYASYQFTLVAQRYWLGIGQDTLRLPAMFAEMEGFEFNLGAAALYVFGISMILQGSFWYYAQVLVGHLSNMWHAGSHLKKASILEEDREYFQFQQSRKLLALVVIGVAMGYFWFAAFSADINSQYYAIAGDPVLVPDYANKLASVQQGILWKDMDALARGLSITVAVLPELLAMLPGIVLKVRQDTEYENFVATGKRRTEDEENSAESDADTKKKGN